MKCNKRQNSTEIKQNKHQKVLETIIKNATQMWCSDPIHLRNPLQFLQLSSHCINDVFMEASQVHFTNWTEHCQNSGNDDDGRYLAKTNSNRKNKGISTKDSKRSYTMSALESTSTTTMEDIQLSPTQVATDSNIVDKSNKSEPPPLAFYPKNRGKTQRPIIFSATEPPPLVPITRHFA